MAMMVIGIGSTAILNNTFAQEAGNVTGSVVVADENNQVTILGQQGPPGPAGADGVAGATGATGPAGANGTDGKDGIVSFRCFDLNNVQITCPFTSVPIVPQPEPPVVIPPVVNETGNVTAPTEPTGNVTGNVTEPTVPTCNVKEPAGNVTAPIGGLDQNGTIVIGGEPVPVPATNETTTTTTTNTTVTTAPDGTTVTNSTSETVPADLNILSLLVPNFGI